MPLKPRKITLTPEQQGALNLMARAHRRFPEERWSGAFTSDSSHLDSTWPAYINFHTGRALLRKGCIRVVNTDPEGTEVVLTERGWEMAR